MSELDFDDIVEVKGGEGLPVGATGIVCMKQKIKASYQYLVRALNQDGEWIAFWHKRSELHKVGPADVIADFQRQNGEWAKATFIGEGTKEYITKLVTEAKELKNADPARLPDEVADIFLICLKIAHAENFSLLQEGRKKHEINTKRKWRKMPDGTHQHVSGRQDLAQRFADIIQSYQSGSLIKWETDGIVIKDESGSHPFYSVMFTLDDRTGQIDVHGENFIKIEYQSPTYFVSSVFEEERHARNFFFLAFLQNDWIEASKVPVKEERVAAV